MKFKDAAYFVNLAQKILLTVIMLECTLLFAIWCVQMSA